LPPVQKGCEFHSLDSTGDSEPQEQAVKVSLHGAPRHIELAGNFGVVTSLQKQLDNLLLSRTQPNGVLLHQTPLVLVSPEPRPIRG
jgi:hypothetical protein